MGMEFIILGLALLVGVVLVIFGLRKSKPRTIEERLAEFGTLERPPTLEELELSQPFSERVLKPLFKKLADSVTRFTPKKSMETMQRQLDLAGNPYGWGVAQFMAMRVILTLLLGGLGFVLVLTAKNMTLMRRVLILAATVGIGYYFPILWLRMKIRNRQKEIVKALPDALDLLTICVEAGLGFDAAMAKVAEKWDNELSRAFARVLHEIQLGKLRREALRDMADRMDVPEVSTFVAAIIQAGQLGVSIAKVLRIQSDQMRVRRRQRAEELARAATLKILPPVVFLIFPAILIVLLGPAIIKIKNMELGGLGF